MTVATTTTTITHIANGVTTNWTFPFIADTAADIDVIVTDSDGNQTTLNPVNYDLTINAVPVGGLWGIGGSVTYPTSGPALETGNLLTIQRSVPYEQNISIANQGAFYPQAVEQGLDVLELQIQQLVTNNEYCLRTPTTDISPPDVLPAAAARANLFLAFDNTGQPTVTAGIPGPPGAAGANVSNIAALKAAATDVSPIGVLGYYDIGDGGGNTFYFDAASTATDDGGSVIEPDAGGTGRWLVIPTTFINVKSFGAKGDGSNDDAGAINNAVTYGKTLNSATIYFPAGTYSVSVPVEPTEVKGINFLGEGPDHTIILSTGGLPAMQCNGIWRSNFQGLQFKAGDTLGANLALFELDGNYDGMHSQGVQGNCFNNCYFDGALLCDTAFAICRQGGGAGQGSENLFLDCFWIGGNQNCLLCAGTNALQNTVVGGNVQGYPKDGIKVTAGNINCYSVGFQSTHGYTQVLNGGFDYNTGSFSAGDITVIEACRTESLAFLGGAGNTAYVKGLAQVNATPGWINGYSYVLNDTVSGECASGNKKLYLCTTAGTSGGSAPTWPESGTVSDGGVVWTQTDFDVISLGIVRGFIEKSQIFLGQIYGSNSLLLTDVICSRDDAIRVQTNYPPPIIRNSFCFTNGNGLITIAAALEVDNKNVFDISTGALVFRADTTNTPPDVYFERLPYLDSRLPWNGIGVTGCFAPWQVAFADLAAASLGNLPAGTMVFCTDATPGSIPATGGGAGALLYIRDVTGTLTWCALP